MNKPRPTPLVGPSIPGDPWRTWPIGWRWPDTKPLPF